MYSKIWELVTRSKEFDRGIRLLTRRQEIADGEIDRVLALAAAYQGAKKSQQAARTMDQMLEFGLSGVRVLELCERVYRDAKEHKQAEACRALRYQAQKLSDTPLLWQK